MRWFTVGGDKRLWFDPDEIEGIIALELAQAGMTPTLAAPAVNVESFVEGHLKFHLDSYAPLPADTLGQIEFLVGGTAKVLINSDLTGAALDDDESVPGLKGRWRATVAHEAAHGILHRRLFDLRPPSKNLFDDLFDEEPAAPEPQRMMRCLKRDVVFGAGGKDWREVQANMGMAALLMPKAIFTTAFHREVGELKVDRVLKDSPAAQRIATRLATHFQVSKQAAAIRMESLELLAQPGQSDLLTG